MSGRAGRTIARRFSERVKPALSERPGKRELTDEERSEQFRKRQRREELRALEEQTRERHANIDKWASEQRRKIEEKYR